MVYSIISLEIADRTETNRIKANHNETNYSEVNYIGDI